jgi:polyhydroxyalkanoate synthesis regulator phasin
MTQTKTKKGTPKKGTAKTKTRFYVVKTVQEARTSLTVRLEDYNRKYITQSLKSGKTFVEDLKADPRKIVVNLFDDGKARITDLNKDARTRVDGFAKDGQAFLTKTGKNPLKTFNDLVDDGKELVENLRCSTRNKIDELVVDLKIIKEGVEKDSRLVIADAIDGSKKALDHVPGKQRIEKEISSRMQAIPAAFNLPSRKDINGLVRRVKQLNAKVDALSKA